MIARVAGTLIEKSVSHIVVDAQGIGYRIFISLSTFYELPEPGENITLHTHTNVKQDAIHLFGFYTIEEKKMFEMMIGISGIGPKLAINILSGMAATDLMEAISHGNLSKLVGIPGVGRKMAERMILELKDKLTKFAPDTAGKKMDVQTDATDFLKEDALSALVNLGYKSNHVRNVLDQVIENIEDSEFTLDVLLKKALKQLSG
ncbi:MAG: Holliday junction branch migration protein RuvA [Deltaproteobacteria bacterium]|nr:Holliday junction branch migration protein RuvA [Deltaproteobacteria bacterium]